MTDITTYRTLSTSDFVRWFNAQLAATSGWVPATADRPGYYLCDFGRINCQMMLAIVEKYTAPAVVGKLMQRVCDPPFELTIREASCSAFEAGEEIDDQSLSGDIPNNYIRSLPMCLIEVKFKLREQAKDEDYVAPFNPGDQESFSITAKEVARSAKFRAAFREMTHRQYVYDLRQLKMMAPKFPDRAIYVRGLLLYAGMHFDELWRDVMADQPEKLAIEYEAVRAAELAAVPPKLMARIQKVPAQ